MERKDDEHVSAMKAWVQGRIDDAELMRRCSPPGTDIVAALERLQALFRPPAT